MRNHFDENHVWMRIGVSPSDETVWRAIDGATVLQQGSHFPGSRSGRRSEKRERRRDEKKKRLKCPNCLTARFVEGREKMEERRKKMKERREKRQKRRD